MILKIFNSKDLILGIFIAESHILKKDSRHATLGHRTKLKRRDPYIFAKRRYLRIIAVKLKEWLWVFCIACHPSLLCLENSSPAIAPWPLKMWAHAKFVSSPSLARRASWQLGCLGVLISHIPGHSLQTSMVSKDIDIEAKFPGAGMAKVGVAGSGLGLGLCLGVSGLLMSRPILWSNSSSPGLCGLCPLGGQGALLSDGGLSHPLCPVKKPSPPLQFFLSIPVVFHLSCIVFSFSYTLQAFWGKWLTQSLTEGRQINTDLKKKRMTSAADFEDVLPVSDLVRPVIPHLYPPMTDPITIFSIVEVAAVISWALAMCPGIC